jgi:hypothetical protein
MSWFGAGRSPKGWFLIPLSESLPVLELASFPVTVGRDVGCDVRVQEATLSREHVLIESSGPDLVVSDLGSSNGIAVERRRVQRAVVERRQGARVTAGGAFTFLLRYCTAAEAEAWRRENLSQVVRPWVVLRGDEEFGPFSDEELPAAARAGQIDPLDTVWHTGLDTRVPAGELDSIRLFPGQEPSAPEAMAGTPPAGAAPVVPSGVPPALSSPLPQPGLGSQGTLVCPCCWWRFELRDLLFVSQAQPLRGDPVLGPEEQARFTPTAFDPTTNHALDAYGWPCSQLACPRCHLPLPQQIRNARMHFLSVVGAPMSGKSVFLACLSRWLKRHLAPQFGYHLTDVDGTTNTWLNEFERILFHQADPGQPQMIDKTMPRGGDHYRDVTLNGETVSLPLPCVFSLAAARLPQAAAACPSDNALLVFYDNAGEHFLPGADVQREPGTRHLVQAEGIVFLLDPVLDVGLRQAIASASFEIAPNMQTYAQENLLNEVFSRIRKHLGLRASQRYDRPVLLCLSKSDLLGSLVGMGDSPVLTDPATGLGALDLDRVVNASFGVRQLLLRYAPDVVRVLDTFAEHVLYVPMSALGHCPSPDGPGTRVAPYMAVRPRDIHSAWIEVPVLYLLSHLGYIATARRPLEPIPEATHCRVVGSNLHLRVDGAEVEIEVPPMYGGYALREPASGVWFRVPVWPGVEPY